LQKEKNNLSKVFYYY